MKQRVLTALAGIPCVLAAVLLPGPALFGAIVLALGVAALHEYLVMCDVERPLALAVQAALVVVLAAVPVGAAPGVAGAALLTLCLVALWRVADPARRLRGLSEGVLGLAYIGFAMASLWQLRTAVPHGAAWVLLVLAATWAGDSAAYFVGSRVGGWKFAPALSPNKTWAGAFGGLAGSLAGGLLVVPAFRGGVPAAVVVAVAAAVGVSGQLGDLFESLWKRAKGVKDSGTLIPGHGGILDRIDSLLLCLPVAYHLVRLLAP